MPGIVEVVVVERETHRESGDDAGIEFGGVGLPLLVGVPADERLVERPPDEADRLLLQIRRLLAAQFGRLLLDQSTGFIRRHRTTEEGADGAQVDGHAVELTPMVGTHSVAVGVQIGEAPNVIDDVLIARVKYVRAVPVNLDAGVAV